MWMGGVVPLGYRVEDRALHVVDDHAAIVRSLFRRYLEAGSVVRLKPQLDAEGVRIPIRIDGGGRSTGGGLLSRGHVYKLLSNPIYVAGSLIRARCTKANTRRSCPNSCGSKSSEACVIVSALRGRRERANRPKPCSGGSSSTIAAIG
jgi:hypothetical protein